MLIRAGREKNVLFLKALLHIAIDHINDELALLNLRMMHPERFVKQDRDFKSPLYWSDKHPKMGLNELLSGLEQLGPILTIDGTPAPFNQIIHYFEMFFNIKLGDPQEIKRSVFRRKNTLTKFTDALRNALIKHSKNKIR